MMNLSKHLSKLISVVFLGLFLSEDIIIAQDDKKFWNQGKLSWEDFQEYHSAIKASELKYFIGYKTEKQKYGDTIVMRIATYGFIDRNLSWINSDYKTDQYLRYNQVIFDIVELYRRKIQYEIDRTKYPYEIENRINTMYSACSHEIDQFSQEAEYGKNLTTIMFWEVKTRNELNTTSAEEMPVYSAGKLGYGMHAGLGSGIFTGTLGQHFSPTFNLIFGFDLAYKKTVFYFNGTLGSDKVRKDYSGNTEWLKAEHASMAIIELSVGYALIDNSKFKIAPFGGFAVLELSKRDDEQHKGNLNMESYQAIFGINTDFKYRTRISLVAGTFAGFKEKSEYSLRTRLYLARGNYYDDLKGFSINLSIGICGFGNVLRL
ncbi:MAG TPA: hypothetical protein VHI78_11870 [Bacteroidales bacterium]|nr:hypothetical protein [Bacteroidales bacterium]